MQHLFHLRKLHRGNIRAQLHQFVTVLLRKDIGMKRHDLAEFNIRWSKILKDQPKLLRGQTLHNLMFF